MEQLHFTSRVLGKKATERLEKKEVTQTIRSENHSFIQAIFSVQLKPGEPVQVVLNDRLIGVATYLNLDPVKWHHLDTGDACRGGFDNRFELASALKRAGYRFKDLEEYFFWRCIFSWPEEKEVNSGVS